MLSLLTFRKISPVGVNAHLKIEGAVRMRKWFFHTDPLFQHEAQRSGIITARTLSMVSENLDVRDFVSLLSAMARAPEATSQEGPPSEEGWVQDLGFDF